MTKALELVVLLFGIITLLFGILALSLDYWQGGTVTVNDILEWELDKFPRAKEMFANFKSQLVANPKLSRRITTTPVNGPSHGINSLRDMVMAEKTDELNADAMSMVLEIQMYLHVGFWHICVKDFKPSIFFAPFTAICADMNDGLVSSGLVHVPQLMFFLGIFLTIACVAFISIILIAMEEKKRLTDCSALITLMAGIFYIAGMAYFVDNMAIEILEYQAAFYFGLFSALFSFVMTGILLYLKYFKASTTRMA